MSVFKGWDDAQKIKLKTVKQTDQVLYKWRKHKIFALNQYKKGHKQETECGLVTRYYYITNLTLNDAIRGAPIQPAFGAIEPRYSSSNTLFTVKLSSTLSMLPPIS